VTIREAYYTNTNPGHNKDYKIIWDQDTNEVASIYGPIGGTKTHRTIPHRTPRDAKATFLGKMDRRERHGYELQYDTGHFAIAVPEPVAAPLPPIQTMQRHDFEQDIRDLKHALSIR
jgi:hypothetical protein